MTTWEEFRKQARVLENDLDQKLVALNKLGFSVGGTAPRLDVNFDKDAAEKAPLISTQNTFQSLSSEIEQVIGKLTEINDQMSSYMSSHPNFTTNAALLHTMQRHRDILRDYTHEFTKTRANITERLHREMLLGNVDEELKSYKSGSGLNNRRNDGFLKEHEHIQRSDRHLNDSISIAISAKDHLTAQRSALDNVTKKLYLVTKRYPALNNLMQKIHLKKRKDSIVLGIVIAVCLILLFMYAWS